MLYSAKNVHIKKQKIMKRVVEIYWQYAKGIRSQGFIVIVLFTFAVILRDILRPIILKTMFDGFPQPAATVQNYMLRWLIVFAIANVAAQSLFRSGEWINSVFQLKHMRALRMAAFDQIMKHCMLLKYLWERAHELIEASDIQ